MQIHGAIVARMGTIHFLLEIVVAVGFVGVGLLMAVWPAAYLRWVRWSKVESYAPWLLRRWDVDHGRWQIKTVGIAAALFGLTAAMLAVFIHWFQ